MNKFLTAYIINIFLIFFFLTPLSNGVKSSVNYFLSPINYVVLSTSLNISNSYEFINKLVEYKKMYEQANLELIDLKSQIALENTQKLYKSDYDFYFEMSKQSNSKFILVDIIGYIAEKENFLIKLNKGLDSNIKVGDTVVYQNYLVGKIDRAEKNISFANVFFLSSSKIPVKGIKNNADLMLSCKLGVCSLMNVLNSEKLDVSEILVTSGFVDSYQKNFIAGSVLKIYSSAENIFKSADIKQEIDIKKISRVAVLTYEN